MAPMMVAFMAVLDESKGNVLYDLSRLRQKRLCVNSRIVPSFKHEICVKISKFRAHCFYFGISGFRTQVRLRDNKPIGPGPTETRAGASWTEYFRCKTLWLDDITIILVLAAPGREVLKDPASESPF
jgi:hypothetical protein